MVRARVTLAFLLVIPAAFAWACGGDDTTDGGTDSGGNDGTLGNDTGPGKDGSSNDGTSNDGTSNDTGTNDAGTNDAGTNDAGTNDGGGSFACTKPSDCTNQFCCGTIIFNGGQIPNCKLEDAGSACKSTCVSDVQLSCNATDTVRTCTTNNDCTDAGTGYTKCCTVSFSDAAAEFCWNATYAGLVGGSCQ